MTAFVLKLIAMGTMLIDHIGFRFVGRAQWMRVVGRCAFILYAFLIAESYYHLREKPDRRHSHLVKLLLLCLVSEIPYNLFNRGKLFVWSSQNVVFTLLLGFLALIACGWLDHKIPPLRTAKAAGYCVICLLAAWAAWAIHADYSFCGVLLIVMFYLYLQKADGNGSLKKIIQLLVLYLGYVVVYLCDKASFGTRSDFAAAAFTYRYWLIGMLIPFIIVFFYSRKPGYKKRWFGLLYSWFYPAHMLGLFLIGRFLA